MPIASGPWRFQNVVQTIDYNIPSNAPVPYGVGATVGAFNCGTLNTMGAVATLIAGAQLSFVGQRVQISLNIASVGGANTQAIAEVLTAPAGTTTYTTFIPNILCGQGVAAGGQNGFNALHTFDVEVPSGVDMLIRAQCADTTVRAGRANLIVYGNPSRPDAIDPGVGIESLGADRANTNGTEVLCASLTTTFNQPFVTLGILTERARGVQLSPSSQSTAVVVGNVGVFWQLGVDQNRLTGVPTISRNCNISEGGAIYFQAGEIPVDIPAGAALTVRGWCSVATATTFPVVAHAVY